jgi:hypothetical protein
VAINISIKTLGRKGVNVDKDPFDLEDDELTNAQNAISDPAKGASAVRKRPGFIGFNASTVTYNVLGGAPLPGPNLSTGGTVTIYIGRGPIS